MNDRFEFTKCPSCGRQFTVASNEVEAAIVAAALPELSDLGREDLDALEMAAVTIVRLRFQVRRRELAAHARRSAVARNSAVPYDGDPNLAPVAVSSAAVEKEGTP